MGGCCLVILTMLLGPRVFLFAVWILTNWYAAFDSRLVAFLGWLFLPYTSLAWMYVHFHNGDQIQGGYLILMIFAILLDLGIFSSGGHRAMKMRVVAIEKR
jgi:hypothetical protein